MSQPGAGGVQASNVYAVPTNTQQDQFAVSGWEKFTGADKAVLRQAARDAILREEAKINRQFQERLSSSAYQRAMQDMKKAGLNPALMYGGAKPASTPSGATPYQATAGASASPAGVISSVLALAGAIATKGMSLAAYGGIKGAATGGSIATSASKLNAIKNATATPAQIKALDELWKKIR